MCAPNKSEETNTNLVWIHGVHGSRCRYQFLGWGPRWILGSPLWQQEPNFKTSFRVSCGKVGQCFQWKWCEDTFTLLEKHLHRRVDMYSLSRSAPTGTSMHLTLNKCIMCVDSKPSKKAVLLILTPQVRFNELWSTGSANYRERYEHRQPLESHRISIVGSCLSVGL